MGSLAARGRVEQPQGLHSMLASARDVRLVREPRNCGKTRKFPCDYSPATRACPVRSYLSALTAGTQRDLELDKMHRGVTLDFSKKYG